MGNKMFKFFGYYIVILKKEKLVSFVENVAFFKKVEKIMIEITPDQKSKIESCLPKFIDSLLKKL